MVPAEKPRELRNLRIRRLNNSGKPFQQNLVKFTRELGGTTVFLNTQADKKLSI